MAPEMQLSPPWRVPGAPTEEQLYTKETDLGPAVLWFGIFGDGTVIVMCGFSGGARYMRISPETELSMEEHYEGELPVEIASVIEDVWKDSLDQLAEQSKTVRGQLKALGFFERDGEEPQP